MARLRLTNLKGINTKIQPFESIDGELTRCVNMYTDRVGSKRKRPGYTTFLGTADGSRVNSLFSWESENGSKSYLYRASGSSLYYYDVAAGTGDWTLCANGTITDGSAVGHTVLNDTLILGDGAGSTRHTTNGTAFTDTVGAPAGSKFAQLYQRVYIGDTDGTQSNVFYSSRDEPTDWELDDDSDSSSFVVPGEGRVNGLFHANDRVVINKSSGEMSRWDDYQLIRIPTNRGFSSPHSRAGFEGLHVGLNRLGFFAYAGDRPELISGVVTNQIYNDDGTGIGGAAFGTAPAGIDKFLYQCAVGTVTDSFTKQAVNDCVMVYNFQMNEWYNYQYANAPTAFHSYNDANGDEQFIFGDANGQVYSKVGTATSDNGTPIQSILEGYFNLRSPEREKLITKLWTFANPGCQAEIQVAAGDTFEKDTLNWVSVQGLQSGEADTHLGQRGRFLFYRLLDNSANSQIDFYGFAIEVDPIGD